MKMNLNTAIALIALIAAALAAYFSWQSKSETRIGGLETKIAQIEKKLQNPPLPRCRICFRETENGERQCGKNRDSCSEWSDGIENISDLRYWTKPFRDDTDTRPGGCIYQWVVQCERAQ